MLHSINSALKSPEQISYAGTSKLPIHYFALEQRHFEGGVLRQTSEDSIPLVQIHQISLPPDKYLSLATNLQEVHLNQKDTTVFNFQVGTGKTRLLHECMLHYLAEPDTYVMFYVAPFKRLLEQNKSEIEILAKDVSVSVHNCVPKRGKQPKGYSIQDDGLSANIYLMTPEFLMGSGGRGYQSQSWERATFKQSLFDRIKKNNKKVILFLDEIHEKTDKYSSIRLAHLYRIGPQSLFKVFVASATFTREAVEVVKAVSMLTQRKITIFQADRIKKSEQASLHLHLCTKTYKQDDIESLEGGLLSAIQEAVRKGNRIHILTAQKQMANNIINSQGKLKEVIEPLSFQLLTSEEEGIFDENKNSVGTTFTTGISIKNSASTLIIIFPGTIPSHDGGNSDYSKAYGIFTSGCISLVQSLARLRNGGEIHIFMPPFANYIHSIDDEVNKEVIKLIRKINLIPMRQDEGLEQALFDVFRGVYDKEKDVYDSFVNSMMTNKPLYNQHREYFGFQSQYDFILSEYAGFRMDKAYKEGKQLSPLMLWLALNDQLTNCTLKTATIEYYDSGKIQLTKSGGLTEQLEDLLGSPNLANVPISIYESLEKLMKVLSFSNGIDSEELRYQFGKKWGSIRELYYECPAVTESLYSIAEKWAGFMKETPKDRFDRLLQAAKDPLNNHPSSNLFQKLAIAISVRQRALRNAAVSKGGNLYIKADLIQSSELIGLQELREALTDLVQDPLIKSKVARLPGTTSGKGITDKMLEGLVVAGFAARNRTGDSSPFGSNVTYRRLL